MASIEQNGGAAVSPQKQPGGIAAPWMTGSTTSTALTSLQPPKDPSTGYRSLSTLTVGKATAKITAGVVSDVDVERIQQKMVEDMRAANRRLFGPSVVDGISKTVSDGGSSCDAGGEAVVVEPVMGCSAGVAVDCQEECGRSCLLDAGGAHDDNDDDTLSTIITCGHALPASLDPRKEVDLGPSPRSLQQTLQAGVLVTDGPTSCECIWSPRSKFEVRPPTEMTRCATSGSGAVGSQGALGNVGDVWMIDDALTSETLRVNEDGVEPTISEEERYSLDACSAVELEKVPTKEMTIAISTDPSEPISGEVAGVSRKGIVDVEFFVDSSEPTSGVVAGVSRKGIGDVELFVGDPAMECRGELVGDMNAECRDELNATDGETLDTVCNTQVGRRWKLSRSSGGSQRDDPEGRPGGELRLCGYSKCDGGCGVVEDHAHLIRKHCGVAIAGNTTWEDCEPPYMKEASKEEEMKPARTTAQQRKRQKKRAEQSKLVVMDTPFKAQSLGHVPDPDPSAEA